MTFMMVAFIAAMVAADHIAKYAAIYFFLVLNLYLLLFLDWLGCLVGESKCFLYQDVGVNLGTNLGTVTTGLSVAALFIFVANVFHRSYLRP